LSKLKEPAAPIPGPSQTSRATLESGAVTLDDGVRLRVRDTDKEFAYLLSEKLHLDEVEAFVLFRSFLYHEGSERDLKSDDEGVDEMDQTSADEESPLLSAIIDFYLEERLFLLRIYEPLFRAHGDESHPYHDVAEEALSSLVPDPPTFISSLITELVDRTQRELPVPASKSPRQATRWAKQTLKEELCLLEGIFWATYDINTPGTVVVQFYSAMYSTSLGRSSKHKSLLLDPDSTQLFSDLHSLFILTGIEILNLESLVNKEETLDLELVTINRHGYLASPQYVEEIHQLLLATPSEPSYAPILLAWAAVLRRITDAAGNDEYPKEYARFLNTICPSPSDHTTFHPSAPLPDPAWQTFVEAALSQNMRLLETLITLLEMPVLSSDAAIRVSSSITSPGDLFFRSTLKSQY
jgi:nuclear pore complex protein Nup188